ncbi:MAG TPA: LacI family DNA-binding transcriptional regulator [Herpetosiphonaceae bacterium]
MRLKQSTVTIHDVARAAGVSVSTASRVLNNKDDVAPETYRKVRQVMEDLNYTASLAAKSMRSRATHVIGLLVPELIEVYYHEVLKGVGSAIRNSGYDLLIYTSGSPSMNRRASWEQEHVALLSGGLTDGCLIVTPSAPTFPNSSMRIVVVDPHGEGANVPSVVATNRDGALQAMDYLTGLGHRRIGFIGGYPESRSSIRRHEGYKDGLASVGVAYDPALVRPGDFTMGRGREAALELLALPERPTALFAANDLTAFGAMEAARELGLRVPEDVSVVGFDNIPEAMQSSPRLTTVDQSIREMGVLGTRLLLDILQGQEPAEQLVKIPTRLIVRESCAPAGL